MKPYLIINEITPVKVGQTTPTLPLHSTLVHWFWLETPAEELIDGLTAVHDTPIGLIPEDDVIYHTPTTADGIEPVRVTTIRKTLALIGMHERTCELLEDMDVIYEKPQYVHAGFSPHITHQEGERVNRSGYVSENLYVVTADRPEYGHLRTILAKVALTK